jgi:nitroreductase
VELTDLLRTRYSCRAFRPDSVPDEVVDEVFGLAQATPSWCNTQPWRVHVLSGEAIARFAKELGEHVAGGAEPVADLGLPAYTGVHADRRRESGVGLYSALGIAREDRTARSRQMLKNFSFFGAPHTAVVTSDRDLGTYGAVDCGAYVVSFGYPDQTDSVNDFRTTRAELDAVLRRVDS